MQSTLRRALPPSSPYESDRDPAPRTGLDEILLSRLKRGRIPPARICSDAVFIRRAHLDVIGTLPTSRESQEFILDADPNKRTKLVDRLLAREEYADYWAMRWCDVLRVKSEFPINLWPNAVQAYHRWIKTSIRDNVPFDRFAKLLLTSSGSNFRMPPVNFYRALEKRDPRSIASAAALTFMGVRTSIWPEAKLIAMAAFFANLNYKPTGEWKEEIVFHDPMKPAAAKYLFPDGTAAIVPTGEDPRVTFAEWLVTPKNPWFARNAVNRIWYWLLGRGLIHEVDDVRPDNPPRIPELLTFLERQFVDARYDVKQIIRTIVGSDVYQLSSIPQTADKRAAELFAHYRVRRLDAEVLMDALNQVTGTFDSYSSAIPEPFTFIPAGQRTISLADGSITSSFLEMFGRPPRDTGLTSERNDRPSAAQRLHLLNSSHIRRKLEQGPGLMPIYRFSRDPGQAVEALYLTILSRFPTENEIATVKEHALRPGVTIRDALMDVAWALINSGEFLYRH